MATIGWTGCWASGNSNWARSELICDVGKSPPFRRAAAVSIAASRFAGRESALRFEP